MTPGARVAAAIEGLDDILARRRPAQDALKEWGLAHRFAGSKDRAAISGLVFDALRRSLLELGLNPPPPLLTEPLEQAPKAPRAT